MRADCDDTRDLIPEVALGIASGEDRARVLEHVAHCRGCRDELGRLAAVTDELLVFAPEAEPPPGFEQRVLRAIAPAQPNRPRRARIMGLWRPAVALAVGAALASGILVSVYHGDHQLASQYRQALAAADGSRFVAIPLRDGAGVKRGSVSMYEGTPSWLVITTSGPNQPSVGRAALVTRSGRRIQLGGFRLHNAVWGGPLPVPLNQVASIQLQGHDGHSELVAFANRSW